MTPDKLKKLRDECNPSRISDGDEAWIDGFDAACADLLTVIDELMEALEETRGYIFLQEVPYGGMSRSQKALANAKEKLGLK